MDTVTITEVTDPFCTWCWGAEPILRRVEETYRDQVEFAFVMGGLIEDFDTFYDDSNDISHPRDVAPHWEAASDHHGMPVETDIWRQNPPPSSFPANIAYKAAEFQSVELAHQYLRRLREAVATDAQDISAESVLVNLASKVGLDTDRFQSDIDGGKARQAFEADRDFLREHRVSAFPSFRVSANGTETWISGLQPFNAIQNAIEQVASELVTHDPRPIPEFLQHQGRATTQEIAEVYEISPGRTMQILRSFEEQKMVTAETAGNGYYWQISTESANQPDREETEEGDNSGFGCQTTGSCVTDNL